ncbi:MAG TPA: polyprenyl synthetase family protein [Pirellulaceae bacterium]|nr:polyprenyl synthetase family protein [Pirellulaceae bacterium]
MATELESGAFATFVAEWRPVLEERLADYCRLDDETPAGLREAIEYVIVAPGKRVRPMLALLAADLCQGDPRDALPAACAVEMIHTYSLVHDDLPAMDDDDLRRGRPTCHVRYGEANAILTGDALLAYAFEILARDTRPADVAARCVAALARAAGPGALVGGQYDDLSAHLLPPTLESLERIHRRKTGAMLMVSLELGARVAGASEGQVEALRRYGRALGMAFQITDDLLDVTGRSEEVGKRTGKDLSKQKLTFPGFMGNDASRRAAVEWTDAAHQALAEFGSRGEPLARLADFVLHRNQ